MSSLREVKEAPYDNPFPVGIGEKIAPKIDILPSWGSSPSAPVSSKIYDEDDTEKTADYMTGSASLSGTELTSALIADSTTPSWEAGQKYKVVLQWTDSGNTLSCYGWIIIEER